MLAKAGLTPMSSDLRVSGPLLPLEICLQIPDQLVMRDRSDRQRRSPRSAGSAEELFITGCCTDRTSHRFEKLGCFVAEKAAKCILVQRPLSQLRQSAALDVVLSFSCAGICWWRKDGAYIELSAVPQPTSNPTANSPG